MTKSLKLSLKLAVVALIFVVTGFVLVGCGKKEQTTYLSLSFEDSSKVVVYPGEIVNLKVEGDGYFSSDDVTLNIISGSEFASVDGLVLTVNQKAVPEETIILNASLGDIVSNNLVVDIGHIEADSIEITSSKNVYSSNELFSLETSITPENATRDLTFKVVEGNEFAQIINNKIFVKPNTPDDSKFKVVATMGGTTSAPFEITVKNVEYVALNVESAFLTENTLLFDTSVQGNNGILDIMSIIAYDGELNGYNVLPTFEIVDANVDKEDDEGCEVIKINEKGTLDALRTGKAIISASIGDVKLDEFTIDVRMLPTQISFAQANFQKEANFNYAVSKEGDVNYFALSPEITTINDNDENSQNYILKVGGDTNVEYYKENGEWKTDSSSKVVSFDGENIAFYQTGNYEISFKSNVGTSVEIESKTINITINNGVNISNKAEFVEAMSNNERTINVTNDIFFAGGHEQYIHYGDASLFGNGFKFDLSGQDTYLQHNYYENNDDEYFLRFVTEKGTDKPYFVQIEDLEVVGNLGLISNEALAKLLGLTENELQNVFETADNNYFPRLTYRHPIYLDARYDKVTYVVPVIKNLNINSFYSGIKLARPIDELELGLDNARPGIENYTVTNMFGDGALIDGALMTVHNMNIGVIGGTPISSGTTWSDSAGINQDQHTQIRIDGDITCSNQSTGSTPYLLAQLNTIGDIKKILDALNGIDGVLKTALNLKISELLRPYEKTEEYTVIRQKLTDSLTNVIDYSTSNETFNLFSFTRNGLDDYVFSEENKSKTVEFNDDFMYNGIDTTHEFVVIKVYDLLMSIKSLGPIITPLLSEAEALKPIMLIMINNNYVV